MVPYNTNSSVQYVKPLDGYRLSNASKRIIDIRKACHDSARVSS